MQATWPAVWRIEVQYYGLSFCHHVHNNGVAYLPISVYFESTGYTPAVTDKHRSYSLKRLLLVQSNNFITLLNEINHVTIDNIYLHYFVYTLHYELTHQ